MPYSEKELDEIAHDRERLRAYFWRMAMHWRRMAKENRAASQATGERHPVTNYRTAFEEGRDLVRWAGRLEHLSEIVLDNMDALVESTYLGPR